MEIQYKILEFVQPLYEQAKVEEVRNSPSVLVLDEATVPQLKAKPKGSIYALVALVASMIVGYFIVYAIVLFRKIKLSDPVSYSYITDAFKVDISRLRNKNVK